jgi:hypothetical protein
MSKLSGVLGAAILCLGLLLTASSVAAMQEPQPTKPEKQEQKAETITISGTVSAISHTTLTIIDSQKAEHTVAITSNTKVTKAGKDATLADVKANDIVTVEAQKQTGNTWAALKIALS